MNDTAASRREFLRKCAIGGITVALGQTFSACANDTADCKNKIQPAKNMPFTLPALPYAYNALEPHFDAQTMEIHHSKHHNAYVVNLNDALAKTPEFSAPECVNCLISDLSKVPENIRAAVRNNGGGHANHSFFWKLLAPPNADSRPSGALAGAIQKTFGDLASLQQKFNDTAKSRFGSGWAWLIVKPDKTLAVISTPNQDSPLMNGVAEVAGKPVLALDVWEHAYYLKYQNRRPDYIAAFWNLVNWRVAGENFENAIA